MTRSHQQMLPSVGLWGPNDPGPHIPTSRPQEEQLTRQWGLMDVVFGVVLLIVSPLPLAALWVAVQTAQLDDTITTEVILASLANAVTSPEFLLLALAVQWCVLVAVPWNATRRRGMRSMARDFGLRITWSDVAWGVGLGLVLRVVDYGIGVAIAAAGVDPDSLSNSGILSSGTSATTTLLLFFAAGIAAPFAEEVFFRGLALRAVFNRWRSPALAVAVSSVVFGLMHAQTTNGGVMQALYLVTLTGALGAALGYAAIRTQRLGVPIVAHMVFNSTAVALVALSS